MNIRREEKESITRVTAWIAGLVAVAIMIILPLGYFLLTYQHFAGNLETEAEINARLISQVITVNPDLWRYESLRLQDLLNRRSREGYPETRRVFDMNKNLVAESVNPLPRPVMNRSHQLMDAGIPVATIEISRSLYPLLVRSGLVGLVATVLAFVIFIPLRLIPLRAVGRAQQALRQYAKELNESNEEMQQELQERRTAEQALLESEKRYRMLFESAGDAIFILEAEGEKAGDIVALNKMAAEMHGYTVDELMHKNIREIETPATAQDLSHLIRRIQNGEWVKSEEVTHRRKNGTVFFAEISAGLLELGNDKYILAFDRDITERKIAENLLLHTQQTLQTILSSMPYGVVTIGLDKKMRSANKAALELMNYDMEEQIVGMICNQSFCPTDEDICPIIDLNSAVNQTETILVTKDGKHVPILKTVVPIEIDGEQVLLEAFFDITDQKNAELKLQRYASELKQSNEDVLSFAYIVSHDLRAPLVSIKGFAGELQYSLQEIESVFDRCMPHLSEKERATLEATYRKDVPVAMDFIKSSVGRMDGLISAILVLSRLGHRELKPEPLDMTRVSKSILSSLAHQIEQRKTVVTIGELPAVTADKLAMEQIMGNLLDNALKYLDPVREGRIAVTAEHNGEEVVFHVADNGRGIAKEDMHKVFEIFRRAGKQDVPGEGMGLAYVKTLVRRLGGRIWCESEPGKGTTFNFTVPHPAAAPE